MYYQHHSAQIVHKDDERIDHEDVAQRQKFLSKEPEVPEKLVFNLFLITYVYIYLVRLHEE